MKGSSISFYAILLTICLTVVEAVQDESSSHVIAYTRYGGVRGHSVPTKYADKTLEVYAGIPYAAAPVGNLRWSNPRPPRPWVPRILDTLAFKPACPQSLFNVRSYSFGPDWNNTDEDCLYLNIYSPKGSDPAARYPVFVWIYGGYFSTGAAEEYDGRVLAVEKDVVVVTVGYRVGVLGYLATDDAEARGNYGQLDQVRALEWVRHNIMNFRGDPYKVTVGGESSGAVSATMHLFSPLTRGLFHGVIAQSGQANSYWGIKRDGQTARPFAFELGRLVGCNKTSSRELIWCLRGKPYSELVERGNNDVSYPLFGPLWGPVIDGYYILEDPIALIQKGDFIKVPMLTGVNKDDASYELDFVTPPEEGYTREYLLSLLNSYSKRWEDDQAFLYDVFIQEYHPDPYDNVDRNREIYVEFQTDHSFTAPAIYHAIGHSKQVRKTYFYSFVHRSANSPEPVEKGVVHGAELDYIFGVPFFNNETCPWGCFTIRWGKQIWTKQDQELSITMMTQWANFMKTGNPNTPTVVPRSEMWPEFSPSEERYLIINGSTSYEDRYHRYRKVKFWNEYVENLVRRLNNITTGLTDQCNGELLVSGSNHRVPHSALTASSTWSYSSGAAQAKIDTRGISSARGWIAGTHDLNQWIQVDLGEVKLVNGVLTYGRDERNWHPAYYLVASYRVSYSTDGSTFEYAETNGSEIMPGNRDSTTPVINMFGPVKARYVRINPVTWKKYISLRFDVIGCSTRKM